MLHAAIINFRRRIVNRTRGFSCRAAAQFNPGIEVLRGDYGGATVGEWWSEQQWSYSIENGENQKGQPGPPHSRFGLLQNRVVQELIDLDQGLYDPVQELYDPVQEQTKSVLSHGEPSPPPAWLRPYPDNRRRRGNVGTP